jgi:hypothetical protein
MQTRDRTACHLLDEVEPLGYSNTQSKKSILLGFGDAPPRSVVSEPSDTGKESPRLLSQKTDNRAAKINFMLDKLWGALYRPL